jgi:hypothetical protein
LCLALLLLPAIVLAQSGGGYNLEWNTIDGGGHTFSSGGSYSLGGTLGQPDAGALSGGAYTLSGGFWYGPTAPQAAIRYAAPTAVGSGDCSSWDNACTLQYALTNAVSGDEIWVKAGVHYPGTAGNRDATFQLKNGVAIYGGFAGTETARNQRNPRVNQTILSGDIDQNDINTDGNFIAETPADIQGGNAYHVVVAVAGVDSTATLDGFIITAGQANEGAYSNDRGGGMYADSSSPTLTNVIFSGNQASLGGGAYTANSSPTLINVVFRSNQASQSGGGMFNNQSSPTLTNVIFKNNDVGAGSGAGGAIHNEYSSPTLTNVTFNGNAGSSIIYNINSSNPVLRNVIMWGDSATSKIYSVNSSNPTISYSDIQGCGYSGGSWVSTCGPDGGGNIDADPTFVNAAGGNLRLDFGSPAIDAGTNSGCPTTDLDGLPRPADGNGDGTATCDMGAYEAGTMICSVTAGNTYTFNDQSGVAVEIVTAGNLACLYVDEMELNHPNATSGLQTGRYWLMRGLQSDKKTDATGFSVNLTLPTTFTPDDKDKVCRYTGSGQVWDCAADSRIANTITRNNVSQFSDWAVGNNVGPTAVRLLNRRATPSGNRQSLLLFAGLAFFFSLLGCAIYSSKRRS